MVRGRFQQQQWEQREAAILAALEQLSAERGLSGLTMDALASEVGISKATLYQHFEGKDALLAALMVQQTDQFLASLQRGAGQPPVERLRAALRMLLDDQVSPLRGMVSAGRDEALPVFHNTPALVERHEQMIAALTAIIEQGQAEGSIAADLDARAVIGAMVALSSVSPGAEVGPGCRPAVTTPGYSEQMVKLFERAIRPA